MFFTSPLWLIGLAPWAGVSIWLLLGRRQRVPVPFVELWKGPTDGPRARPSLVRPPLFVLLAILALLLAVLAATRPMGATRRPHVVLILDRGMTMLLRGADATDPQLLKALEQRFGEDFDSTLTVPRTPSAGGPVQSPAPISPSLIDTTELLPRIIRQQLENPANLVVVNTDQSLNIDNPRLIISPPLPSKPHPKLLDVAARAEPRPQVMVRLRDVSPGTIEVESAGRTENLTISSSADEQTLFIDMPLLGREVSVKLKPGFSFDSRAFLVREDIPARIVGSPGLPESLQRMIAIYGRHRPGARSQDAFVVTDPSKLPVEKPAVLLTSGPVAKSSPPAVQEHPLTANVKFPPADGAKPPPGWKSIVSSGDTKLVAVKDGPPRQVWVCLNDPTWAATPNYVIFWTNVFDWLGGGSSEYRWHPMSEWSSAKGGEPVPGVFQQADGTLRAFNAIGLELPPTQIVDWRKRLDALPKTVGGGFDLTPFACISAIVLMSSSLLLSKSKSAFSLGRKAVGV